MRRRRAAPNFSPPRSDGGKVAFRTASGAGLPVSEPGQLNPRVDG